MPKSTDPDKPPPPPIPWWVWVFVVACAAIPVVSLGGAIPAGIGGGGAAGCIGISRNAAMPAAARVGICVVVTAICWALFGAFIYAMKNL